MTEGGAEGDDVRLEEFLEREEGEGSMLLPGSGDSRVDDSGDTETEIVSVESNHSLASQQPAYSESEVGKTATHPWRLAVQL